MTKELDTDWVNFKSFHDVVSNAMTYGTLRNVVRAREKNGAKHFCRKMGRRLLLSPSRFYEWVEKEGKV